MSRNQRIGLVVLAVVVAVAGFLILQPEDEEERTQSSGGDARTKTADGKGTAERGPRVQVERIAVRGGVPQGGVRSIRVTSGDAVRLVVTSDTPDEVHLHGYDITRRPAPGKPARFAFSAKVEGVFEIESHVAEDAGKEPLIARLVVEPS
jgi:hypothetical protein